MKVKISLVLLLIFTLVSCDLISGILPSDKEIEQNSVVEGFISDFDIALSSSDLTSNQRSLLKTDVTTKSTSVIDSEDLTIVIPKVVGLYIEGLGAFTNLSEETRLNAIDSISSTSIEILNGNEELINASSGRGIAVDKETLLFILENISRAIVKNVPKCGFSKDTYAKATERTVKSLVGSLDEGGLELDTISAAAQVLTQGAISQLSESDEFVDVKKDMVKSISKGATKGVAEITIPEYTKDDMAPIIESVAKGAVEGLGNISNSQTDFKDILPFLTQGAIEGIDDIKDDLGDSVTDSVAAVAKGSTKGLAKISIVDSNQTGDLVSLVSESISENALGMEGVDKTAIINAVVSGVAEGAQEVSEIYNDPEVLADKIKIKDSDGSDEDISDLTEVIKSAQEAGQATIPESVKAIRKLLNEINNSKWWENSTVRDDFIPKLKEVATQYQNEDLGEIYFYLGNLNQHLIWDQTSDKERKNMAPKIIDYYEKAANNYDTTSYYAFNANLSLVSIYANIIKDYDKATALLTETKNKFPNDNEKQLRCDYENLNINRNMMWDKYGDFSGQRVAFIKETLLPLINQIIPENYPGVDPTHWEFAQVFTDKIDAYIYSNEYDKGIELCNTIISSEPDNINDIYRSLANLYSHQGGDFWNNSNYTNAIESYNTALETLNKINIPTLDKEEKIWLLYDKGNYTESIGHLYSNLNNSTKSDEYFESALSIFKDITEVNYPNAKNIFWIFDESIRNVLDIYGSLGLIDDAENLVTTELSKEGITTSDKAKLFRALGNMYRSAVGNCDSDRESLPFYQKAIDKYEEAKVLLISDGDTSSETYYDILTRLLELFRDKVNSSYELFDNHEITLDELKVDEEDLLSYSEELKESGIDNNIMRRYYNLGVYYLTLYDFDKENDTLVNAIGILETGYDMLADVEIDSWIGSEIKRNLERAYIRNEDLENAETILIDIIADPNMEDDNKAWSLESFTGSLMNKIEDIKHNYDPTHENIDPIATKLETYANLLYSNFTDINDGYFTALGAMRLGVLYHDYYFLQKDWKDSDSEITNTKQDALKYLNLAIDSEKLDDNAAYLISLKSNL